MSIKKFLKNKRDINPVRWNRTKQYRIIQNILTSNNTQSPLYLQEAIIKKVTLNNNFSVIDIETDKTVHVVLNCN